MRKLSSALILILLSLSFLILLPVPITHALTVASSNQKVSVPNQCGRLVQPCFTPTYEFALNGAVYVWNNYGDNISLTPSITGFNPTLSYNSSYFQYQGTFSGCTITSYFTNLNPVSVTHKLTWSGCPTGTWHFNLADLKGFGFTVQNGCFVIGKNEGYAFCNSSISGATISASGSIVTIAVTSSSGFVDPILVQSALSIHNCVSPCAVPYGSNVATGDILIMAGQVNAVADEPVPTDSQFNVYFKVNACVVTNGGAGSSEACLYYTTATGSTANTITWTPGTTSGIEIYEVSSITTGFSFATGTGNCANGSDSLCTAITSTSVTQNGGFDVASTECGGASIQPVAGTGFTLDFPTGAGGNDQAAEHSTSGTASDPTNYPMTCKNGGTAINWSVIGATFPVSTVTQPVTCTMDNSGIQQTVTLSGGSPSPSTLACDGASHNITVQQSTTLTATEPSDGTNTRARFSGVSTTTSVTTCSSGTCTAWTFTNYYQYSITNANSLSITRTSAGSSGSVTGNDWYDYKKDVIVSGVRWVAPFQPFFIFQTCAQGYQTLLNVTSSPSPTCGSSKVTFSTLVSTSVQFYSVSDTVSGMLAGGQSISVTNNNPFWTAGKYETGSTAWEVDITQGGGQSGGSSGGGGSNNPPNPVPNPIPEIVQMAPNLAGTTTIIIIVTIGIAVVYGEVKGRRNPWSLGISDSRKSYPKKRNADTRKAWKKK